MLLSLVFSFWLEIGCDPVPPLPAPHGSAVTCRKTTEITLWTVALCNGEIKLQRSPWRSLHFCVFANSKAPTIFLESSSLDPSERNCFIYRSEIVSIDPRIFVGTCKRTLLRSRLSGCHATLRRRLRPWLHETGTNSDRYDFWSVSIQMLVSVYIRPVWKTISCRFHSFQLLNRHEWLGLVWSRTTEPCKHELIWDQSKITVLSMRISVVRPFQDGGKQKRV